MNASASSADKGAHPKAIQSHLGLRHTCAALLISHHRSITTTLDRYGHLFEDEHDKLADRLDSAYIDLMLEPDEGVGNPESPEAMEP